LTRHGLPLSGGVLAVMMSHNAASAAVPASVVSTTFKAATAVAAGQTVATGAISAKVAALTEGVLKAMFMTKLKIVTAVLLAVCVSGMGAGASGLVCRTQGAEKANSQPVAGLPLTTAGAQDGQKRKNELQELEMKLIGKYVTVHVAKREIENALKRLREATNNDKETELEALVEIEQVVKEMKEKVKKARQKEQKQAPSELEIELEIELIIAELEIELRIPQKDMWEIELRIPQKDMWEIELRIPQKDMC
jgi:hypothetical protein